MTTKVYLFNKAKYSNVLSVVITHLESNTSSLTLLSPNDSTYFYLDNKRVVTVTQHMPNNAIIALLVRAAELPGSGPGVHVSNDILTTSIRRGDEMDVLVDRDTKLTIKEE